jgi:hypothetical protein
VANDDDFENKPTPPPRVGSTPKTWRMSDSERERHRRAWVRGVPVVRPEPDDEITAPLELLLNGQLDVDDYAQVEALRRSSDDVYVLLLNLARAISRHRDKDRSGSKEVERQVLAAIEKQSSEMAALAAQISTIENKSRDAEREQNDRLTRVEGRWKLADKVIWMVVVATIGSVVAVGNAIWNRSAKETEMEFRMRSVEKERQPWRPDASQKDSTP